MDTDSNQFLLGEINATVKGTADDVKALRLEMGSLASALSMLATRITAIETEREAMKPEYHKNMHTMRNHIQADVAWKAAHDAEVTTQRRNVYVLSTIIGLVAAAGTFILRLVIG